jgi:hypothetical protein
MPHSGNVPIFRPYLPHTSQGVLVGTALTPTPQEWEVSYNYNNSPPTLKELAYMGYKVPSKYTEEFFTRVRNGF